MFWELHKLHQLGKVNIAPDDPALRLMIERLHVWPVTKEICYAQPLLDFSSDPIDELIAATSIVHHVPLLTRDRKISASKVVPLAR